MKKRARLNFSEGGPPDQPMEGVYEVTFHLVGSTELLARLPPRCAAASGAIELQGTNLQVRVTAATEEQAQESASRLGEQFCDNLALLTGEEFSVTYSQLVDPAGRLSSDFMFSWRELAYDPSALPSHVQQALDACTTTDDILRKAGAYFRHALFLHQEAQRDGAPVSFHSQLFTGGALLNYYKAMSIIVGEPRKDSDYQSRYRQFGIAGEMYQEVVRVRRVLRDAADVAHYEVGWEALERVKANIEQAKRLATSVIQAYARFLKTGSRT